MCRRRQCGQGLGGTESGVGHPRVKISPSGSVLATSLLVSEEFGDTTVTTTGAEGGFVGGVSGQGSPGSDQSGLRMHSNARIRYLGLNPTWPPIVGQRKRKPTAMMGIYHGLGEEQMAVQDVGGIESANTKQNRYDTERCPWTPRNDLGMVWLLGIDASRGRDGTKWKYGYTNTE
ncbi:hypothetical protein LX36DRAFT_87585 [Colletotrichum falcatum]|nr:hypothetical protein LX36DRAFT_87585 [Colletotrichum falcatum]